MRRRNLLKTGAAGVLTLSSASGTANAAASSYVTFTVKWNNVALTDSSVVVSSDKTWATCTWTASSSTVKVTCTENTSFTSSRSATITVTYQGVSATYSLTQSKHVLSLSPSSSSVTGTSGSTSFTIQLDGSKYTGTATVSSNQTWASASNSSGTVTVSYTANTSGSSRKANITVTASGKSATFTLTEGYSETITSIPYDGTLDGYKYITINGVKWAINNVGATNGQIGNYYSWGETTTKSNYDWSHYSYNNDGTNPSASNMTKYNSTDGKTVLDSSDDVAKVSMGGSWRMPTTSDRTSIISNVTCSTVKYYNGSTYIPGTKVASKSDSSKYLFFPWGGQMTSSSSDSKTSFLCWGNSVNTSGSYKYLHCCGFGGNSGTWTHDQARHLGRNIRGVHD